jgi:hypothetical protein
MNMGKATIFQPDHLGRRTPDSNPGKSLARSHNMAAETAARHGDRPNIARDAGRAKHVHDVKIHGGMVKVTKGGALAFGGDHATAMDSLTGLAVVPDKSGAVATAHPLTTPPKAKNLSAPMPHPSMRSRVNDPLHGGAPGEAHAKGRPDADALRELGDLVIAEGFANSASDDRMAHGRAPHRPYTTTSDK